MIHDLELTTVIDVQGTLTPVLTDKDKAKIDKAILCVQQKVIDYFIYVLKEYPHQSTKLAMIEVARRLNASDEDMTELIKKYQDEL